MDKEGGLETGDRFEPSTHRILRYSVGLNLPLLAESPHTTTQALGWSDRSNNAALAKPSTFNRISMLLELFGGWYRVRTGDLCRVNCDYSYGLLQINTLRLPASCSADRKRQFWTQVVPKSVLTLMYTPPNIAEHCHQ